MRDEREALCDVLPRVVHNKREPFDIYIGRPSKWGNPFEIGKDGTRDEVVDAYAEWIKTQPDLLGSLQELRGKTLGCWCAPKRCHGDVLLALANESYEDFRARTDPPPWGRGEDG